MPNYGRVLIHRHNVNMFEKDGEKLTQNSDFINKKCKMCGKEELALSVIELSCGYGSLNDGENIRLNICGECADKVYSLIKNQYKGQFIEQP